MEPYRELERVARANGCEVCFGEPMSRHTTFQIGGPARLFLTVGGEEALGRVLQVCAQNQLRRLVIGKGSNLLMADEGFDGVVIRLGGEFEQVRLEEGYVVAGAAASLARACAFARDHGLSGLEFAWGIPGSVGGAAFMNAGAYGGEMKDVVRWCRHVDVEGKSSCLEGEALDFGYRQSAYTANGGIVTSVCFALQADDSAAIRARMEEYMQRRASKQPLEYPSAGSVFKRPPGHYAGGLIEQCGLKGLAVGGAQVSEKHAGFIINRGGATCADVLALIERIQSEVLRQTGVTLECEIRRIV